MSNSCANQSSGREMSATLMTGIGRIIIGLSHGCQSPGPLHSLAEDVSPGKSAENCIA
jgi:hypothetical protein